MKIASADANVRRKQTNDVSHPFSLPKTLGSSKILPIYQSRPTTLHWLRVIIAPFSPILVFVWGYKHYTKDSGPASSGI